MRGSGSFAIFRSSSGNQGWKVNTGRYAGRSQAVARDARSFRPIDWRHLASVKHRRRRRSIAASGELVSGKPIWRLPPVPSSTVPRCGRSMPATSTISLT